MSSLLSVPGECPFTGRETELQALDRAYRERPGFAVLYGRRRIGKTRLVREWLHRSGARGAYYFAQLASHKYNLRLMAEALSKQLGDPLLARLAPDRLGDLLLLAHRQGAEVVVIDEFTYWARSEPRVLSELQEFVDTVLPGTRMLLLITGSLIGVMESRVLGGGSPLYARPRWRLRLGSLPYWHASRLLRRMSPEDRVRVYALVGGIPFYLCMLRDATSAREALELLLAQPGAPLRDERELLLREELREPRVYSTILSALARGYDRPSQIAAVTGIDEAHVRKYLHTMESLGFVGRDVPLFKRKGRYIIADPILRTWHTIAEPLLHLLELGRTREALNHAAHTLEKLAAQTWEDLARTYLLARYAPKGYTQAGRLEHKGEEIDIAIIDPEHKKAIIAEAKWRTLTLGKAEKLRKQAQARAARLLPKEYTIEETLIAARNITTSKKTPWIITPEDLQEPPRTTHPQA